MVFSSLAFLCVFLPAVFLLALAIPSTRAQNVMLLIASLLFYAYGEPVYTLLMVAVSLVAYVFGRLVGAPVAASEKNGENGEGGQDATVDADEPDTGPARKAEGARSTKTRKAEGVRSAKVRKALCVLAVVICLGCLGTFKYAGWLFDTAAHILGSSVRVPEPSIVLPIGISFYTFQALSYIVDVYRGDVAPQRNVIRVLLYISFFPQLIAGPIIRYHDIEQQLERRRITLVGVQRGMKRFVVGLAKKVLVADVMAAAVDPVFAAQLPEVTMPVAWLAALAYLLQIYFDFSGYSDMAIGMAHMFGFTYKENFNYPYVSTSVKEFWRRWHISLSTWLKEYLYIPLGGNRRGRARTVANKVFVFFCCGLWHGAAWTFVVWGLIHGFFLLLEEYLPIRKLPKPLGWIYCMLVVTLAFVVFRAETFEQAAWFLGQMLFGWSGFGAGAAAGAAGTASVSSAVAGAAGAGAAAGAAGAAGAGAVTAQAGVLLAGMCTPLFLFTLAVGAICAFPVLPAIRDRAMRLPANTQRFLDALSSVACLALFAICLLTLASGAYSPFIYFRF